MTKLHVTALFRIVTVGVFAFGLSACGEQPMSCVDFLDFVKKHGPLIGGAQRIIRNDGGEVTRLNLNGIKMTHAMWDCVAKLESLAELHAGDCGASDEAIRKVKGLKKLELLTLSGNISAKGIEQLSSVGSLKMLSLYDLPNSENIAASLVRIKSLTVLVLDIVEFSGEDVKTLFKLPSLQRLNVLGANLDEAEISQLKRDHSAFEITPYTSKIQEGRRGLEAIYCGCGVSENDGPDKKNSNKIKESEE